MAHCNQLVTKYNCVTPCGMLGYNIQDCSELARCEEAALAEYEYAIDGMRESYPWDYAHMCRELALGSIVQMPRTAGGAWFSSSHGFDVEGIFVSSKLRIEIAEVPICSESAYVHELGHYFEWRLDQHRPVPDHSDWDARGINQVIRTFVRQ